MNNNKLTTARIQCAIFRLYTVKKLLSVKPTTK